MSRSLLAAISLIFITARVSSPAATVSITEYTVPTAASSPWGITMGPISDGGALWFTEGAKIGRLSLTGSFTEYPLPTTTYPNGITVGPDGALWFGGGNSKVGRITTSGTITEYAVPHANGMIVGIVSGPDDALWFTETNANQIGRITTTGTITEYPLPSGQTGPWLIVVGDDGALWFTADKAIGRITIKGAITMYNVPTANSYPWGITMGRDGALWFTEEKGVKIGRITLAGAITEFPVPTTGKDLSAIVTGPDGSLWFSDVAANKIGNVTTAGVFTEYDVPTAGSGLRLLAFSLDDLFFTEQYGNKIGRVKITTSTCSYSLSAPSASVAAAGGSGSFNVTAGAGCAWTASPSASWITTTSTGSGNGTVSYNVAANSGLARSGTITVGGQTFTINQAASGGGTTSGNLITNGDAEAGPGGGFGGVPSIPGWSTDGNVAVVLYTSAEGDLDMNSPGPANRGKNYFAGGRSGSSTMTQTIDLSSYASAIDGGSQPYTLDGWLGGFDGQDDNVKVAVTFQNSSGTSLGTAVIGPVYSVDRGGVTELIERTTTGKVPTGTRKILVTVGITRTDGSDNDGMLDNLSFTLAGSTSTCTYTLNASSQSAAATASSITVNVTAGSGCAWQATSSATWITISAGASGTGNGSVTLQIAANTGSARSGTATIAGQTFTVNQAGASTGCSYNVNPTDVHATAAATSGTLIIFTNTGCAWTASKPTGADWITLNPTSGTGQGAVGYSITANAGPARSTTLTVAGTSVNVTRDAGVTCTYGLGNTTQLIPGLGGAGAVAVTVTGSNCAAWSVTNPASSWIHITAGSSSTTSGTVSYYVDPNTGTSQRSAILTIANQSYTITEDVPPCSYSFSSYNSPTISATGGTGSVQITASSNVCPWSAALPSSFSNPWVHFTSAANANGSGTIAYSVDPNPTTSARSVMVTINCQKPPATWTYTIAQAAGAANTGPIPTIDPGGVVNSASFISANLQAGALAQGSFFSIFGNNLGPDVAQKATSYPLGTTLGGVTVTVKQGSITVQAYPIFVAPFLINAVMPSNAPTGTVQVTVTYNNNTSPPMSAQVVPTNFAAFSISGGRGPGIVQNWVSPTQVPLNTASVTAAPRDIVILWGTGLGPLPNGASDAQPPTGGPLPVSVSVNVGNLTIKPDYAGRAPGLAGVDQINFTLPANVATGCYVSIQVTAAGMASNTVTLAIAADRQPCSDTNPLSAMPRSGGKNATLVLSRLNFTDAAKPSNNGTADIGLAIFEQLSSGGDLAFDLYASLPPRNSCTYYSNMNSVNSVLVGGMPSTGSASLNAGMTITIAGPKGTRGFTYADSSKKVSPYFSLLGAGGSVASSGLSSDAPFLDPGAYTISGAGGPDIGPFSFPMTIASGATWTNRDQITSVDRTKDLNITWSGGNPSNQVGVIIGLANNASNSTSGGFACVVTFDKQSFTVPSGMMANLPPVAPGSDGVQGGLLFLTFPSGDQFTSFTTSAAPALDKGLAMFVTGDLRSNISYK